MNVRKPDLKAPRIREEAGYCPINRSFWRKFKRETGVNCTYLEFSTIIKLGNELISDVVANERDGFKLMENIGTLVTVACSPSKKKYMDYNTSNELGVRINHQNLETDRKLAAILYVTYGVRDMFLNRKLWGFDAVRPLKRNVSSAFRDNHTLYKQVQGFATVSKVLRDEKNFLKQMQEEADFLKNYDEFDLNAEQH